MPQPLAHESESPHLLRDLGIFVVNDSDEPSAG